MKFKCLLVYFLLITPTVYAQELRIPRANSDIDKLPNKLLLMALNKSTKFKPTFPYGSLDSLPFSTRLQGVRNGELDIFSAMTTKELESEFQAIYIPIYKGLMGMRLSIVKQENKNLFANVKNLEGLKKFSAGQGTFWADSKILEANNLTLIKELKYHNMFRMLEADRFQYFPRGAHEPWAEIEQRPGLKLIVEPHIMLSYKAPFYFFVAKDNQKLAKHLTEQLNTMIQDGSFNKLFYEDVDVKKALTLGGFHNRKIIELENPYLSDKTPVDRDELWFDPASD